MPCILLVKNIPSRWGTGAVVGSYPKGHKFGIFECKKEFIESGIIGDFPRVYIQIEVSDLPFDAPEIKELLAIDENTRLPKKRLKPQGSESPYYKTLLDDAYIVAPSSTVFSLIEDNI